MGDTTKRWGGAAACCFLLFVIDKLYIYKKKINCSPKGVVHHCQRALNIFKKWLVVVISCMCTQLQWVRLVCSVVFFLTMSISDLYEIWNLYGDFGQIEHPFKVLKKQLQQWNDTISKIEPQERTFTTWSWVKKTLERFDLHPIFQIKKAHLKIGRTLKTS